ncbi:hypothetical protein BDN72DRAFT_877616 [Pluteus cervinus]|uniref:Uncharacterized protein n=1 Tax=Pluteus cervinus TaxID=181527 RepID=A0ACD3AXR4_9AGAR|nr:hypothetical protein BDN72DRAFT_877616 [Pluteus cervinus]
MPKLKSYDQKKVNEGSVTEEQATTRRNAREKCEKKEHICAIEHGHAAYTVDFTTRTRSIGLEPDKTELRPQSRPAAVAHAPDRAKSYPEAIGECHTGGWDFRSFPRNAFLIPFTTISHSESSMSAVSTSARQTKLDAHSLERTKIDEEIVNLFESIRKLKTKRNTLAPISGLPAEMMIRIFDFVCKDLTRGPIDLWTTILRVSQHWRIVGLGSRELWCSIVFDHRRFANQSIVNTFIQRAGSQLLDIRISDSYFPHSPSGFSPTTFSLLQHLSRIRSLSVKVNWSRLDYIYGNGHGGVRTANISLREALSKPAPFLEELSLSAIQHPSRTTNDGDWTDMINKPLALFAGEAPRLMSLVISDFSIRLNCVVCQNLTALKLDFHPDLPSYVRRVPFCTLFDLLLHTRLLRSLELVYGFDVSRSVQVSPPGKRISLPNLQSFLVKAEAKGIYILLSELILPLDCGIHIVLVPKAFQSPASRQVFLDFIGDNLEHPAGGWSTVALYAGEIYTYQGDWYPCVKFVFWDGSHKVEDPDIPDVTATRRMTIVQFELPDLNSVKDWLLLPRSFQTASTSRLKLHMEWEVDQSPSPPNLPPTFFSFSPRISSLSLNGSRCIDAFVEFTCHQLRDSEIFPLLEHVDVHLPEAQNELLERFLKALRHRSQTRHIRLKELKLSGLSEENDLGDFPAEVEGIRVTDYVVVNHDRTTCSGDLGWQRGKLSAKILKALHHRTQLGHRLKELKVLNLSRGNKSPAEVDGVKVVDNLIVHQDR